MVRDVLRQFLSREGFEVLIDVRLPGMGGPKRC